MWLLKAKMCAVCIVVEHLHPRLPLLLIKGDYAFVEK